MDKYQVIISPRAYKNLDDIYKYISKELFASQATMNLINKLEEAILSLETMPYRFSKRKIGAYSNKDYRQLFVNNYTIIYRIDNITKKVFILVVKYSKSNS